MKKLLATFQIPPKPKANLDERGIIVPGAEVKEGDILVGKVTPRGQVNLLQKANY